MKLIIAAAALAFAMPAAAQTAAGHDAHAGHTPAQHQAALAAQHGQHAQHGGGHGQHAQHGAGHGQHKAKDDCCCKEGEAKKPCCDKHGDHRKAEQPSAK